MTLEINICGLQDSVQVTEINLRDETRTSYQLEPASHSGQLQKISPDGTTIFIPCTLYIHQGQRLIFTIQPGYQLLAECRPDIALTIARHPDGSTRALTLQHRCGTQNRACVNMGALGGHWAVRAISEERCAASGNGKQQRKQ